MNRQQKRAAAQRLRKSSAQKMNFKEAQGVAEILEQVRQPSGINEGDKVVIDYEKITATQTYTGANPMYREFIETHKGKVFTAQRPENRRNKQLFVLAEDPSKVKWLFWGGHLKKIQSEGETDETNESV